MKYPVRLTWHMHNEIARWDAITAWAIEQFGMPGARYHTEVSERDMIWIFRHEKDALLFALKWGDEPNAQTRAMVQPAD